MVTDEIGPKSVGVHLVVGGFPPGSGAGHDMDFVRLHLLQALARRPIVKTSVANDFGQLEMWLGLGRFLITYTAGPHPNEAENEALRTWLQAGGRWRQIPRPTSDSATTPIHPSCSMAARGPWASPGRSAPAA